MASHEAIREAFADSGADDLTFVLRQCLELGAWDHALALCDAVGSEAPGVRLCRAVALFVAGKTGDALHVVNELLAAKPQQLSALAVQGQMLARMGDSAGAQRALLAVVERYPDYPGAHGLLSTLAMPGPHYRDVLAHLHDRLRPRTYLEIGVESGATLALARHSDRIIGIDPADYPVQHALSPAARIFREESDAFFARHSREQVLGTRRVDLAFIDGMHRFENALRDFSNAEQWAHADATIVFHDCVPLTPRTATRERATKFWVGDTWKVVLALTKNRPDLRIRTVLAPPSGLVIVRRLNPGSTVLAERSEALVEELEAVEWSAPFGQVPVAFGAVTNDERGLAEALS